MYVTTNSGLGRYRGFGTACTCVGGTCMEDGNSCSSPVVDSGNVCDTTSKMFNATICNNLYAATPTATQSLTTWMNANGTMLAVGAGVSLLMLMLSRGR